MKRDYCSDCGTTYDTRGLCACTEPDWLQSEVQRLQSEVQRLQACALPSEGAYIAGRVDGERIGFRAGQEAMRERCARAVYWHERDVDGIEDPDDAAAAVLLQVLDVIRALEVEHV